MPTVVRTPETIPVPGEKRIDEYVGRARTGTSTLSVARMVAPPGWDEPFQTPDFDEVTIVLSGTMRVDSVGGSDLVASGETVLCAAGERIRYANASDAEPCVYWAVCVPAFSVESVNREE